MEIEARLTALMAAAQSGDGNAYRSLLRNCMPLVAAMARQKGIRGDAVYDVVQDTLLTIHRARATFDPGRSFLAWLRAMTDRRAIDDIRRQIRRQRETHDPVAYETHPDPLTEHRDGLPSDECRAALSEALGRLPPGQRQAIELQERSLDETAATTGRSKGALKVDLHRALKNLRGALRGVQSRPSP